MQDFHISSLKDQTIYAKKKQNEKITCKNLGQ